MSGWIVQFRGGPMDGLEAHRDSDKRERTYYVIPGDPRGGVHWYVSPLRKTDYRYQGVREYRRGDEPYRLPLPVRAVEGRDHA